MKRKKLFIAIGLVAMLAAVMVSPALAGYSDLIVHDVTLTGINCQTGDVTVSIAHDVYGTTGVHTVTFANTSTAVSVVPHNAVIEFPGSATETITGNVGTISDGDTIKVTSHYGNANAAPAPITVVVSTTASCGGGIEDDGRINLEPWSLAVAYCNEEDGIKIYQGTKENKSYLLIHITAEELATYPDKPATDTLIASVGNVSLYKLTTGEYQMMVGPDSEGKTQLFIWRDCNRDTEYYGEIQASMWHMPMALLHIRRAA